jgi:hypothetical protein
MSVVGDQVVDPDVAASLIEDVGHDYELAGWIVVRDQPLPGGSWRLGCHWANTVRLASACFG